MFSSRYRSYGFSSAMDDDSDRILRLQEPIKFFIEQYESFVTTSRIWTPKPEEAPGCTNPGAIPRKIARRPGNTLLLRTKFGLRLHFEDLEPPAKQETDPEEPKPEPFQTKSKHPASNRTRLPRRRQPKIRPQTNFHYLMFPNLVSSSFLWYDPKWGKERVADLVVEPDEIERRYPQLAPYLEDWSDHYHESYDKRECFSDDDRKVFPNLKTTAAFHVAGFLMAYWLVQQEDVTEVRYNADEESYRLDKKNLRVVLQKFLWDEYRMVKR